MNNSYITTMKALVLLACLSVAIARPPYSGPGLLDDDDDVRLVYSESRPIQSADGTHHGFGHKMQFDTHGPHGKGTLKVEETHVVSNRRLHPHEADTHVEKLVGSMGDMRKEFHDFIKSFADF